jgi:carboxypeptidase Q
MMPRRAFLGVLSSTALSAQADWTAAYRESAAKLIAAAFKDESGWRKLMHWCDRIGPRLSGSPALEQTLEWSAAEMKREGLSGVSLLPVKVPCWVRGSESCELVAPVRAKIHMLGLGGSVDTPPDGIEAEVVCVSSFEELEKLDSEQVRGRIVVYNQKWEGYGRTVRYRSGGAVAAARKQAVAALVRSVTGRSLRSPHTGMMRYDDQIHRIPVAAISVEDAERIARLTASGTTVRVKLTMEARTMPDADSANLIGEIPGREKPEEIVVLGGHSDSWDVGQGAHDDASGCIACWQAVQLVKELGLQPRRTLRVCLWTNEENGLRGGGAYAAWAGPAVKNHVAAIEMDGGAERPVGFGLSISDASAEVQARAFARLRAIATLLEPTGATQMTPGGGGADIGPLMRQGVPGLGHRTVAERYMDYHHSEADTLDKIDPADFRKSVAALAVLSFVLADMPEKLTD